MQCDSIPQSHFLEDVCRKAEEQARKFILAHKNSKKIEFTITVRCVAEESAQFEVEVDIPAGKGVDFDAESVADAAVEAAFRLIDKELSSLEAIHKQNHASTGTSKSH